MILHMCIYFHKKGKHQHTTMVQSVLNRHDGNIKKKPSTTVQINERKCKD